LAPFELGLLTEEMTDDKSRFENDYFWCVDPLDGTLSFIESTHGYSISIALVAKDGIPVLGVIFDPLKNILYHAIKDRGVFKNNEIWKFDSSENRKITFRNACRVIENAPACYFKFPTEKKGGGSLWDFAASACIFSEMGLHVSDYNLDNLDLNRPDSTFMNHRGILFSSKKQLAKQINKLSF
jgi:3'-phosphoadenosine 5'-phosphosulfate (PAPS) 3'-phosphatase